MNRRAFTLVELLVVISIIGLMSSIAVVSLNGARIKSRDTKRIADLKQIRLALSMYYNDNGYYPSPGCYDCNSYNYSFDASWNTLASALSPYLAKLPVDPINSICPPWQTNAVCYSYAYGNVGRYANPSTYDLAARLEDPNNPERCGVRNWTFGKGLGVTYNWCPDYNNQMYEVLPAD